MKESRLLKPWDQARGLSYNPFNFYPADGSSISSFSIELSEIESSLLYPLQKSSLLVLLIVLFLFYSYHFPSAC